MKMQLELIDHVSTTSASIMMIIIVVVWLFAAVYVLIRKKEQAGIIFGLFLLAVSLVMIIVQSSRPLLAKKNEWLTGGLYLVGLGGVVLAIYSGFQVNKKMGRRINPAAKKIMISTLIFVVLCLLIFSVALLLKKLGNNIVA